MFGAFWLGMKEALGAADERVAAFEETKQLVGGAGDADAHAFADGACGLADFAEPEWFVFAEIHAVMAAIDLQGLREAPRTAGEVEELGSFAMALHDFDAFQRLERANQDGCGGFGRLADDVEHEVRAIVKKHVDVAGGEVHGFDARSGPAEMMTGGVARRIGFGFDDAAADASGWKFMHHDFANEETREFNSVGRKFGAANAANGNFLARFAEAGFRGFREGAHLGGGEGRGHSQTISVGKDLLKVVGGKQIVVITMAAEKAGDVRTPGDDAQVIRARKIERGARELRGHAVAFEWRRNFRVLEHDAIGETAISDNSAKPVHGSFEAMGGFVVRDSDGVQI